MITTLFEVEQLAHKYRNIISSRNIDIIPLCEVAQALHYLGYKNEFEHCFEISSKCIHTLINSDRVDIALEIEGLIYNKLIKIEESEENYYKRFNAWSHAFQNKARSLNLNKPPQKANSKICFILHTGFKLAHTSVMLEIINSWIQIDYLEIYVAILGAYDENFIDLIKSKNITVIICHDHLEHNKKNIYNAIHFLREELIRLDIYSIIWVSLATQASYSLALPLAPRQIFWSLKLHPIKISEVCHHVCGGHLNEKNRTYNNTTWDVSPFPLTVEFEENKIADINNIRNKFPLNAILLGSLAREDKYNSESYLIAIGSILSNNEHCFFLYTGRKPSLKVKEMSILFNVESRCCYIGWVDTNQYSEAIDIFLETFPFGCGVTSFQAMSHKTPVLSYEAVDTMYGYFLLGISGNDYRKIKLTKEEAENLDILTAINLSHYISLAEKLIHNPSFRKHIGNKEYQFYMKEHSKVDIYAERLLSLVLPKRENHGY